MSVHSLRPSIKPQLMHSPDGDLFLRISMKDVELLKAVPRFEVPEEYYKWVATVVPGMTEDLFKLYREKRTKLRRKARNAKKLR